MATATSTRRSKATDTRKPNLQPNALPATVTVIVLLEGEEVGPISVPQNAKLSDSGNVTYRGGIKGGWELEGEPNTTLKLLEFVVDGQKLAVGSEGVHNSSKDNPTVFHSGVVALPVAGGEPKRYSVRIYATYSVKFEAYSLSIDVWPVAPPRPRGPQVVGQIGAGFSLRPKPIA